MTSTATATGRSRSAARRRQGRPLKLPLDATAFADDDLDADARIGWLLLTSRLLHPDPDIARRRHLVDLLNAQGVAADLSRISRWESGHLTAPPPVLLGYETALGLPHGALFATGRAVSRAAAPARPSEIRPPEGPDDEEALADELEQLVEDATTVRTALTGHDWLRLGLNLAALDHVFLARASWRLLCTRLLGELARTTGIDQVRRYEAAVEVLRHPRGQRHLVHALGEWLTHPDVQVTAPLLGLLGEVDSPAAARLVVTLLGSPVRQVRDGALGVAAVKVRRAQVDEVGLAHLAGRCRLHLSAPGSVRALIDALDLAGHLPDAVVAPMLRGLGEGRLRRQVELARARRLLVEPALARPLAAAIATEAGRAWDRPLGVEPDPMLERLVREALFHVHGRRRAAASSVLALSPFATALTDALVELTRHDHVVVAAQAWELIGALGPREREPELLEIALGESRSDLRVEGLLCLGLAEGELDRSARERIAGLAATARRRAEQESALFALGRRGPATLDGLLTASGLEPGIYWWQGVGGGLTDADHPPGGRAAS